MPRRHEDGHTLIKCLILIFSGLFFVFLVFQLIAMIGHGLDITNLLFLQQLFLVMTGTILCGMAFYGACMENECMCYISLVFCVLCFIGAIFQLVYCISGTKSCTFVDYVIISSALLILGLLVVSIYSFVLAISK